MNPHRYTKTIVTAALASFLTSGSLLAQTTNAFPPSGMGTGFSPLAGVIEFAIAILYIVGMWKVFVKAGEPGWASIIPIYNVYVLCKIAGKPGWWVLLMLIPFVNVIIAILVMIALAQNFGKGAGFALGLVFLGVIFFPILGFGDARYQGRLN